LSCPPLPKIPLPGVHETDAVYVVLSDKSHCVVIFVGGGTAGQLPVACDSGPISPLLLSAATYQFIVDPGIISF
jgi:hypothetical protein